MAGLRLDEITDQDAHAFAAKHCALSPSGINRGLRTLRRALNLAYEWKKLDKPTQVTLAVGERQRDRVLTNNEVEKYLRACPRPWRDCATMIRDEGSGRARFLPSLAPHSAERQCYRAHPDRGRQIKSGSPSIADDAARSHLAARAIQLSGAT